MLGLHSGRESLWEWEREWAIKLGTDSRSVSEIPTGCLRARALEMPLQLALPSPKATKYPYPWASLLAFESRSVRAKVWALESRWVTRSVSQ